jgi:hypothetical protein
VDRHRLEIGGASVPSTEGTASARILASGFR